MILEEFTNLMSLFIENDFPVREIPILFIFSMRVQISEITSDKHYNMLFPEFLEAFCRVIDKSCPIPPNESYVINIKFIFFIFIYLSIYLLIILFLFNLSFKIQFIG
jgi:hypothetical protein